MEFTPENWKNVEDELTSNKLEALHKEKAQTSAQIYEMTNIPAKKWRELDFDDLINLTNLSFTEETERRTMATKHAMTEIPTVINKTVISCCSCSVIGSLFVSVQFLYGLSYSHLRRALSIISMCISNPEKYSNTKVIS